MTLLGIRAEGDFLQARPSWHPYHVLTYQVFYLFSFYDLPPLLGWQLHGAGAPVCLALCSTFNARHIGDAQHTFAD